MDLTVYQQLAIKTAVYPNPIIYPVLGLNGEAGEVAEKVKKVLRDKGGIFSEKSKLEIARELGDALWYIANIAIDIGYTLNEIAQINLEKLESRAERNKLHGEGDER